MKRTARWIDRLMLANARFVAGALALVLALNVIHAINESGARQPSGAVPSSGVVSEAFGGSPGTRPEAGSSLPTAASSRPGATPSNSIIFGGATGGDFVPGLGHVPNGIHGNTIDIVYYWKGDRASEASAFLGPTGQKGALDEADAFYRFIAYVNKHPNGTHTFMGFRFNLHGWKLKPIVVNAGQYPDTYAQAEDHIVRMKPFAAVSSHGGLSDYMCPALAKAHIFNPVTYNLYPGLVKKTGGWCLPASMSWEKQVKLSADYVSQVTNETRYCRNATCPAGSGEISRVYGVLYAEYPGLHDAIVAPGGMLDQFKSAGINIPRSHVYSVPEGLADSASPAAAAAEKMKADGINTIIDPDAGALITFTHAASGKSYTPDYFVWPCSGQDAAGQVRLYDAAPWARARGLSCFDDKWGLDLTLDDNARKTQWFTQYREVANNNDDPPATSPLVYSGILPVLVGITNAGARLSVERFFAGMKKFRGFRYDAIDGPTTDPAHFMLTSGEPDGSQIGDVAEVTWSNTRTTPGNATAGAYVYSSKRWQPGDRF